MPLLELWLLMDIHKAVEIGQSALLLEVEVLLIGKGIALQYVSCS
jgi:hypothetical protein